MPSLLDSLSADLVPPTPSAAVPPTNLLAAPAVSPVRRDPPGRRIDDVASTRQAIYGSVLDAFRSLPPATNSRYTLRLDNLDYEDPEDVPLAKQKAAILQGDTVTRRLRGDWVLADVAGNEVDRRRSTVAAVPHLTERGTYIVNGVEYTLANQLRLRPGIYARQKANGEAELHVNTMPGKGVTHRYFLDPESGIFRAQFGQARLPALPILEALGATDEELTKAWGADLLAVNRQKADAKGLDAVYSKLIPRGDPRADHVTKRKAIADFFKKMEFDPAVTMRTLGMAVKGMDAATAVAATKKLLAVTRGEADSDDRDHMANQLFFGPEDLFSERARRAGTAVNPLLWAATYDGSLRRVPPNALTKHVQAALLDSGLGNPLEEVNAADVFDQLNRVTRLGVGGIACYSADTEVLTEGGWKSWPTVTTEDRLACNIDGRLEFHKANTLYAAPYCGLMYGLETDRVSYLVTPDHRVWASKYTAGHSDWTPFRAWPAAQVHSRRIRVLTGCEQPLVGGQADDYFAVQPAPVRTNRATASPDPVLVPVRAWFEFLAAYLADGSFSYNEARRDYRVEIGKCVAANPTEHATIAATLAAMPFAWRYEQGRRFVIKVKSLAYYVSRFGKSADKYVPDYVKTAPLELRRRFFDIITTHDCSGRDEHSILYTSASQRLRDDVAMLGIGLGYAVTYSTQHRPGLKPQYQVRFKTKTFATALKQRGKDPFFVENYDGTVYCASVPGTLLYVRRNGKCHWSGNSLDAVPADSRMVQPSHFNFIDPIITPESLKAGVDGRVTAEVRKGSDGLLYSRFLDKTGQPVWLSAEEASNKPVALPGELDGDARHVAAVVNGRVDMVDRNDVEYAIPDFDSNFSPIANLLPFRSGSKAHRTAMGSRFITQALPLVDAEAPLVRSADQTGQPYDTKYGDRFGAVRAEADGRVESVSPEAIVVRYADGRRQTHQLYNMQPYNRKTYIHNLATVQPGDPVTAGQLIARSNFTDGTGTLALGRNLRTAYMPYKGAAYEDAVVVSESAAKKLTSQHMYQHEAEFTPDTRRGKAAYLGIFPAKYDRRMTDVIDDDGAVKPGTVVQPGDPLVLAASPRALSHKQVHSAHKGTFRDDSLTWDHHEPGTVVDVARTAKGIVVTVETHKPLVQADKLCFDPETKILTRAGWKFVPDVRLGEAVFTLNPDTGFCEWQPVSHVWEYSHTGQMVQIVTKQVDMLVTPDHKVWAAKGYTGPDSDYRGVKASELIEGGVWRFRKDGAWEGQEKVDYVFPSDSSKRRDKRTVVLHSVKADDWAEFLGYYLAEGWCQKSQSQDGGYVKIGQFRESPHWIKIDALLTRMGLKYRYDEKAGRFEIGNSWFYRQLVGLGDSYTKRVPEWVQELCPRQLRIFFDAYMNGDGHRGAAWEFSSSSEGLMYDLQLICVKLGWATHVVESTRTDTWSKARHWRSRLNRRQLRPSIKPSEAGTDGRLQGYVPYDGKVYCVTVPNHTLYVSRNGKTYWSQNSGRMGDKGVCSRIVPDAEMPHDEQGRPFELILNPLSVISRANTGQVFEALLGKIAAATGKPYDVTDMGGTRDWTEYVQQELDKHGMSSTETVVDPTTGRRIPGVLTGVRYALKLMHTAASKDQGRGLGAYTADDTPAKTGGPEGSSKRVAMMDVHSLLSSGATEVLRDAKLIRGQKNQEYWADFMAGNRPATPNVPLVYRKFIDQLRGSGINVVRTGNKTHLYALTDADTEELAGDREIRSADTVDWANGMKPIPGGLFDPTLTGGHGNSSRWSFMTLVEPMPSPVMEEPIRRLLGLTKPKFEAVLAGRDRLGTGTGPTAIHAALKSIDVDAAIAKARDDVKSGRASLRDAAVRRLGYLTAAQRAGVHPSDWMWTKLPIIPPAFRPVSVMQQTNSPLVADANFLYKEAFDANGALRDLREKVADVGDERLALYSALKAVTGLGDPIQPKNQEKHVRGLLRHVFGWNPKQGVVQQKLLGTSTDMVGRAVVVPNPDLSMDEVGLPEERAWAVYTPFVVRRLVKDGVSRLDALRFAKDRTPIAKRALLAEMGSRPVIVTRAPVLHRYGELAFMPKLVKGDALHVPPVVVGGFGMDFDGDQQIGAVYVAIPNNIDGAFARTMIPGPNPILTLENYRMPFSASLGIPALPADHTLCVFNLEDFPHGAFSHTSKGQFGHIDWYHVQDGVQVLAHDHETGHMKWTAVSMWSKHHGCPVELVELQSGRQLVTDDDPRAVYGVAAGSVALTRTTPTDALAKKFLVPRVVRLTVDDAVAVKELSTAVLVGDRSHVKRNRLKPAIAADHSFGYLVGVLAGDGWVITDKKTARAKDVCLAGITDEVIAKTHASISQLYVDDAPKACSVVSSASYGESRRTTWTSTELAEFLAPMIGHGAANKHLPPWFLSVSKECREGLFAGLMDTDGSISVSNAKGKPQLMSNFASNSLRLVQEVQLLAMSLDIKGRITASKTPGGNDHWTLSFSNLDIARWGGKGMVHPEKLAKLASVTPDATSNIAARNDLVPIPFELVKPLRLAVYKGKTKTGPWESPQQCSTYLALAKAATTGYVTRQTAKFALAFRPDFDHPALPAWRAIVDNDRVTWDPVVAVEKTGRVETGYDLTVPGYETFMAADGVVLSNTSNYHVPASDEARDEALAKMLPSRNLFSVKTFKADVFGPRQEYSAGLYAASTRKADRRPRVFRTARDAARAYYNGEIDADHPIEILEHS